MAVANHIGDLWQIAYTLERKNFYGVTGTPTIEIDGLTEFVGTYGSCSADAAAYRTAINQRLAQTGGTSPIAIDVDFVYDASNVTVTATFELLDAASLVSPHGFVVLVEDDLVNGSTTFQHVARAGYHEAVSLVNPGDSDTIVRSFPRGAMNMDHIQAVAFVQSMTGGQQVYQAMSTEIILDFNVGLGGCLLASVPNGNGTVEFTGTLSNISEEADELTVGLEDTFGWAAEFKLDGEAGFHTAPSVITLGPDEEIGVTLRVTTDGELRKGAGGVAATSANSMRTKTSVVTIFNGSPAVLVVGDDGYRQDEIELLTGLDATGYLYDHWDCYLDHSSAGPGYAEMSCYDVVVWHHGFEMTNLLTTDEINAIMDFMDSGKGFILSSQDLLTQTSPVLPTVFKTDYLGIGSFTINVDADHVTGVAGDPISDGMNADLVYPYSHYDRADDVAPSALGTVFLRSEDQDRIAIRTDNGTARSVFLAYSLNAMNEALPDPNNGAGLLDRAIQWVLPPSGQSVPEGIVPGLASQIRSITPSPMSWNGQSSSAIRMRISERAAGRPSRLDVVDLSGRLVRNLVHGALPQGVASAEWDGRDTAGQPVGAGVYYLRLETVDGQHSARTVVIR